MSEGLVPGDFVRHPGQPDWGTGQVQSVVDGRATVNFEEAGKVTINLSAVQLVRIDLDAAPGEDNGR